MINIAFYAGTHGNFLEFVLNKLMYGDQITMSSPITGSLGTSHSQRKDPNYQKHRYFKCSAWPYQKKKQIDFFDKIIKIDFSNVDDLTVVQLNLKRAEDYNIDPDTLETGTYFKLLKKYGPDGVNGNGPNRLADCIKQYSNLKAYYDIKGASWPDILTLEDFYSLPVDIINECVDHFGFVPFQFNEQNPDVPRWILRDIFKNWFLDTNLPSSSMEYFDKIYQDKQVYSIPLRSLYNIDQLKGELSNIEKFFNLSFVDYDITRMQEEFINKVPFLNSTKICQQIIDSINTKEKIDINLNTVEEGFINAKIKQIYGVDLYNENNDYFFNTEELGNQILNKGRVVV
jgi:hypothetical protein